MTRFLDGPAAGQQLMLHRAPLFLRVCESAGGIDSLDMLDDEPAEGEVLFAYYRVGRPTSIHIDYTCSKTRRRKAKWLLAAEYRVVKDQPSAMTMGDSQLWREWCNDQWQQLREARGEQVTEGGDRVPGVEGRIPGGESQGGVRPAPDADHV